MKYEEIERRFSAFYDFKAMTTFALESAKYIINNSDVNFISKEEFLPKKSLDGVKYKDLKVKSSKIQFYFNHEDSSTLPFFWVYVNLLDPKDEDNCLFVYSVKFSSEGKVIEEDFKTGCSGAWWLYEEEEKEILFMMKTTKILIKKFTATFIEAKSQDMWEEILLLLWQYRGKEIYFSGECRKEWSLLENAFVDKNKIQNWDKSLEELKTIPYIQENYDNLVLTIQFNKSLHQVTLLSEILESNYKMNNGLVIITESLALAFKGNGKIVIYQEQKEKS